MSLIYDPMTVVMVVRIALADYLGLIGGLRALFNLISFGLADCNLLMDVFFADEFFSYDYGMAKDKVDSVPFFLP